MFIIDYFQIKNGTLVPLLVEFSEAAMVSAWRSSCLCRAVTPAGLLLLAAGRDPTWEGNTAVCQQCSAVLKWMEEDAGSHPKHRDEQRTCAWIFTSFCPMSSCCSVATF